MKKLFLFLVVALALGLGGFALIQRTVLRDCIRMAGGGFRPVADERNQRFLGKVQEQTARCRGGDRALPYRDTPWLDWTHYWGTADSRSLSETRVPLPGHLSRNGRGVDGALLDLEYQRIELIKFNLFDNYTFQTYANGDASGTPGRAVRWWPEMKLPASHPSFAAVGGDTERQLCSGELIRFRTVTGICNDIMNPAMGSTGMIFARNVTFEETFPIESQDPIVRNRHGDRLGLLQPDPQVISRVLFSRQNSPSDSLCNQGRGVSDHSAASNCSYKEAPFFNVIAAFWIQFMTHDWFSHLREGRNAGEPTMALGCQGDAATRVDCRPGDRIDPAFIAQDGPPPVFAGRDGQMIQGRARKTTQNTNTAWWDASQLYGYDATSRARVKRDPTDPAKLLMVSKGNRSGAGERYGYLPVFEPSDPMLPDWAGQEAAAFPDNWSIGLSFLHNLFVREHNIFVEAFRERAARTPDEDSGLRDPAEPGRPIPYAQVSDDELFEVARLVVAAEIAKIHTIEWTTQLLYDEPLFEAMNANWGGLLPDDNLASRALGTVVANLATSGDEDRATQWYSVFASGAGIVGTGNRVSGGWLRGLLSLVGGRNDFWDLSNPDHVNGGVNHFGSPFNFPEEFVTVYRLHPLVPDLIEYREWDDDPDVIRKKVPVVATFRGRATPFMEEGGLADWAISMGRQRLGALLLQNSPRFLQNLQMARLSGTPTQMIDVVALDIIRDRERGVPRFNEFRRQYGLKQLTSFDDFVNPTLPDDDPVKADQRNLARLLRQVYGTHVCDASKVITRAQLNDDGSEINDCLGQPHGSVVDNVEDVDVVVGWLAETTTPHGFAISETQFQVFILNASRRLFSDRFFTSSYRPEFYTTMGIDWVNNNGPGEKMWEPELQNGHRVEVSPLKRILLRAIPELAPELEHVVNAFDPWARDRGEYYSLEWRPRPGAENDEAFRNR